MIGHCEASISRNCALRRCFRPRGATVVLVLGLLAVTLAVSYTMMRTQITSLQIQTNLLRRDEARHAALTGMATALRRIHEAEWQDEGVDEVLEASLGQGMGYRVTFATGDETLLADNVDGEDIKGNDAEYPFRLTITAVGYATDPAHPTNRAEHRQQTVVQLVRRAMADEPEQWTELQAYTLVQWADKKSLLHFPLHIEGPVKFGGNVRLCNQSDDGHLAVERYLTDLRRMYRPEDGDYRPLSGPAWMPLDSQRGSTLPWLSQLGVAVENTEGSGSAPLALPESPKSYRLYPGGKSYNVPIIDKEYDDSLSDITLIPDPMINPLGVFRAQRSLTLGDETTIRGTIITSGSNSPRIELDGRNILWEVPPLPKLHDADSDLKHQLPAALVKGKFQVCSNARATMKGTLGVWDELKVEKGDHRTHFNFTGRVFAERVTVEARDSWDEFADVWLRFLFWNQFNTELYFPQFFDFRRGMSAKPKISFSPDVETKTRWIDWSQPIYRPRPEDKGRLMWDLIR